MASKVCGMEPVLPRVRVGQVFVGLGPPSYFGGWADKARRPSNRGST